MNDAKAMPSFSLLAATDPVTWSGIMLGLLGSAGLGGIFTAIYARFGKNQDDRAAEGRRRREGDAQVEIERLKLSGQLTESEQKIRHNLRNEFQGIISKLELRIDAVERERDIFKWAYCQLYYASKVIQQQWRAMRDQLVQDHPGDPKWNFPEVPLDALAPEALIARANPSVTVNVAVPPGDTHGATTHISVTPPPDPSNP